MPDNVDKEVWKEAIKEAISEWLESKFAQLGKWTFGGLMAAAFAGAVYLALKGQGWSK
jgi:hypothetical protein